MSAHVKAVTIPNEIVSSLFYPLRPLYKPCPHHPLMLVFSTGLTIAVLFLTLV